MSASQALVQIAHCAALAGTVWPEVAAGAFVVLAGGPEDLAASIEAAGREPWQSGHGGELCWFVEPDLLWEPTCVALRPGTTRPAGTLWRGSAHPTRHERGLAVRLERAGIDGAALWATARSVFGGGLRPQRVAAARALAGGHR